MFQLSNYSSMEGVLYCKPHFEQLFKETGSFNKNFHSRMYFPLAYKNSFIDSLPRVLFVNLPWILFSTAAKSAEKLNPELVNNLCDAALIKCSIMIGTIYCRMFDKRLALITLRKFCFVFFYFRLGHLAKLPACSPEHKTNAQLAVKLPTHWRR